MTGMQRIVSYILLCFNTVVVLYLFWCAVPGFEQLLRPGVDPDARFFVFLISLLAVYYGLLLWVTWSYLRMNSLRRGWLLLIVVGALSGVPALFILMLASMGSVVA